MINFFALVQEEPIMECRKIFELLLSHLRGISKVVLEGNFMKELKPKIGAML